MSCRYTLLLVVLLLTVVLTLVLIKKLRKNKEKFVEEQDVILFFYANWCPHCTTFKPEVIQFKNNQAKSKHPVDVQLLEEATCPKELMQKHNVRGFPTVVYTNKSKTVEFNGQRSNAGLEAFLDQCRS